jgi:hypothetical protein
MSIKNRETNFKSYNRLVFFLGVPTLFFPRHWYCLRCLRSKSAEKDDHY